MKTNKLIAMVTAAVWSSLTGVSLHAQTPILEYGFNTSGATQTSTGSDSLSLTTKNNGYTTTNYVNSTPVGPSGSVGDTALDFAGVSTAGGAQAGTLGTAVSGDSNLTGLSSFTISGWVSDVGSSASLQTLFALNDINVPIIQFSLYGTGGASRLQLSTDGSAGVTSVFGGTGTALTVPYQSAAWTFVAVTYDSTTKTTTFYEGADGGSSLSSYVGQSSNLQAVPTSSTATSLYLGDQYYNAGTSLNGDLDNLGLYNSALTGSELNSVFETQSIPEPSTAALFIVGGFAILAWRLRAAKDKIVS